MGSRTRVQYDHENLTRQNIRKLVKDGFIIRKPTKIHSRSRARKMKGQRGRAVTLDMGSFPVDILGEVSSGVLFRSIEEGMVCSREKVGVHDSSVSFDMKRILCGFSDFMLLNELWRSLSKSTKQEICKQIQEEGAHNSKP
ncbi:hypothetical protein Sjap_007409 [Stephania japonica]|uniref:Uncharacterized protein n=1 Tax=Stephania japonica TaxID=461633 RepID=A0AAP0JPS9_9MAGN